MQDQPRRTTFVAGASGLYIAADLRNFQRERKSDSPFISVQPNKRGKPATTVVDHAWLRESLDLADRDETLWFDEKYSPLLHTVMIATSQKLDYTRNGVERPPLA